MEYDVHWFVILDFQFLSWKPLNLIGNTCSQYFELNPICVYEEVLRIGELQWNVKIDSSDVTWEKPIGYNAFSHATYD